MQRRRLVPRLRRHRRGGRRPELQGRGRSTGAGHRREGSPRLPARSDVFAVNAIETMLEPLVRSGGVVGVLADAVRFVDASVLGVLVDARDLARRHGGELVVVDASAAMRITLEITGLGGRVPLVDGNLSSGSVVLAA